MEIITILPLAIGTPINTPMLGGVQASSAQLQLLVPIRRKDVMPWIAPRPFRRKTCHSMHMMASTTTPIATPLPFPAAHAIHVAIVLVTDQWGERCSSTSF